MPSKNFEDLEIWQEAKSLAVDIFKMWEQLDGRGYFGLRDQMQRSVVSIASNIAEGKERKSATEFVRYLYIAKGSSGELRTQLSIFRELQIATVSDVDIFVERTLVLSRKISRLISTICEMRE